jgi:hypothetical protein
MASFPKLANYPQPKKKIELLVGFSGWLVKEKLFFCF